MKKREFIRQNREQIDEIIRKGGYSGSINDKDREGWLLNHEGLYRAARSAGVRL